MNDIVNNLLSNASAKAEQNESFEGFPPLDKCSYKAEFRPIQYGTTSTLVKDDKGKDKIIWSDFKSIDPEGGQAIVRTDNNDILGTVSYTHLTLPTKRIV